MLIAPNITSTWRKNSWNYLILFKIIILKPSGAATEESEPYCASSFCKACFLDFFITLGLKNVRLKWWGRATTIPPPPQLLLSRLMSPANGVVTIAIIGNYVFTHVFPPFCTHKMRGKTGQTSLSPKSMRRLDQGDGNA